MAVFDVAAASGISLIITANGSIRLFFLAAGSDSLILAAGGSADGCSVIGRGKAFRKAPKDEQASKNNIPFSFMCEPSFICLMEGAFLSFRST